MQVVGGNQVVDHLAVAAMVLRRDEGGDHFAFVGRLYRRTRIAQPVDGSQAAGVTANV
jgi:hypothetical protein